MAGNPAVSFANLVQSSATSLSASSTDPAFPLSWLPDQLLSKTWRSKLGWTIIPGFNDKLDFNRGGVKVATVAAGQYTTGAAMAAAIVAALEAADPTPVWAAAYNAIINPFRFGITCDLQFQLLFATGVNLATSIHHDLGYLSLDTALAAGTREGQFVTLQSRQWIGIDVGGPREETAAIVIGHNTSLGSSIKLQSSNTSILTALTAPTFTETLIALSNPPPPGAKKIHIAFFPDRGQRYLALLISDLENQDGFSEIGVLFVGSHVVPPKIRTQPTDERDELSQIAFALEGAHYQMQRPTRRGWHVEFVVSNADKVAIFEPLAVAVKAGRNFFFTLDSSDPTNTRYVYLERGLSFRALETSNPVMWRVEMDLLEALG